MEIKFKKIHEAAILPTRAKQSDSGWDVYAIEDVSVLPETVTVVKTGLQVAYITPGFEIQVRSRSGNTAKLAIMVSNQPGTVDNLYRGEIMVLMNVVKKAVYFKKGDRIAQLVPMAIPESSVAWTETVEDTVRGANGIGSTGN